jgi:hypothetical protein
MARIGSQGRANDLWFLVQAACYEPEQGHQWEPTPEVAELLDSSLRAYDSGYRRGDTVPFHPGCRNCGRTAKRVMERRGLSREQLQRLYATVGAKWLWSSREKDEKRRNNESGDVVVDFDGAAKLAKSIERREKARLVRQQHRLDKASRLGPTSLGIKQV